MLCIALFAAAQPAFAARCPPHRPVTALHHKIEPVEYVRTVSSKVLTDAHYGHNIRPGKIMGLAGGYVTTRFTAAFKIISAGANLYCMQAKKIDVHFDARPKIYIAGNFKRGTCEYHTVLKHEYEHAGILKQAHRDHIPPYRQYLRQMAYDIPVPEPATLSETHARKKYFIGHIRDALAIHVRAIMDDIVVRQKAIDTPEIYRREQAKCKRWEEKLGED